MQHVTLPDFILMKSRIKGFIAVYPECVTEWQRNIQLRGISFNLVHDFDWDIAYHLKKSGKINLFFAKRTVWHYIFGVSPELLR